MILIKELTRLALTLTFRDETGAEVTPMGVTYRITDDDGAIIFPSTSLEVTTPTAVLVIPATDNVCISPEAQVELRRVVVTAVNLAQEVYKYRIERVA